MRLSTILTLPGMSVAERGRRLSDLVAQTVAARLPRRVRYWAFVQTSAKAIPSSAIVPEVLLVDVLARAEGGPQ